MKAIHTFQETHKGSTEMSETQLWCLQWLENFCHYKWKNIFISNITLFSHSWNYSLFLFLCNLARNLFLTWLPLLVCYLVLRTLCNFGILTIFCNYASSIFFHNWPAIYCQHHFSRLFWNVSLPILASTISLFQNHLQIQSKSYLSTF